jgi:hypothetical protein
MTSACALAMRLDSPTVTWLLEADEPSVRVRVLEGLLDRPHIDSDLIAARREIGTKGWAEGLLRLQLPDGQWVTPGTSMEELYRPKYVVTNWCLLALAELGATRSDPRVVKGAELLLRRASDPSDDNLGGEGSEVCFTGNCVRMMTRFGYGDDPRIVRSIDWLVSAQKEDGGWHCFPSTTGTLDAWEALAAFAALPSERRTPAVRSSIDRGLEFFLESGLLREGPDPYAPWLRLHYPTHYYYDALVGLEIVTSLGRADDRRLGPALDWLESKRNPDGRWNLDSLHPDLEVGPEYLGGGVRSPYFPMGFEHPGRPSRWITLRALEVLRRAGRA